MKELKISLSSDFRGFSGSNVTRIAGYLAQNVATIVFKKYNTLFFQIRLDFWRGKIKAS